MGVKWSVTREVRPLEERFWEKVDYTDGCWLWLGATDGRGYGTISRGRRGEGSDKAHRISWELTYGPVAAETELDHLCRTPLCVRPDHLEPVTHAENMRRGAKANRTHCPSGHPYDAANTFIDRKGGRRCRECNRLNCAAWYARKKGA